MTLPFAHNCSPPYMTLVFMYVLRATSVSYKLCLSQCAFLGDIGHWINSHNIFFLFIKLIAVINITW